MKLELEVVFVDDETDVKITRSSFLLTVLLFVFLSTVLLLFFTGFRLGIHFWGSQHA